MKLLINFNLVAMQCDEECSNYNECMSPCPPETCENTLEYDKIKAACENETCVEGLEYIIDVNIKIASILLDFHNKLLFFRLQTKRKQNLPRWYNILEQFSEGVRTSSKVQTSLHDPSGR